VQRFQPLVLHMVEMAELANSQRQDAGELLPLKKPDGQKREQTGTEQT